MKSFPVRRNTLVLGATLLILAIFAWAGWANWEYRRQEAERLLAGVGQGELVPVPGGGAPNTFLRSTASPRRPSNSRI